MTTDTADPVLAQPGAPDPDAVSEATATLPGDSTLAFLAEGYGFGLRRFERFGTDAFRTRLMGRRVTFLRGTDAARFFYEQDRFIRDGAIPSTVVHSLQDLGSVQTLTGAAHRHRKSMFTEVLDAESASRLSEAFDGAWDAAAEAWPTHETVDVIAATGRILTAAALEWAGIPASADDIDERSREFLAMIDGAGSFGPRNIGGRALRRRTEHWAADIVRGIRAEAGADQSRPAVRIATWRNERGDLLDEDAAVVELLNILRPVVAVSRFIVFAVLALHQHPQWRDRVRTDAAARAAFTEEVRRTAPFFPAIAGRASRSLRWRDLQLSEGDWVILDMFATNRHPHLWDDPGRFRPERFLAPASDVVAQGAGDSARGHRCPGEPATIDLLAHAVARLSTMAWSVPDQDLRVDLRRFPAAPGRNGIRIRVEGRGRDDDIE